jgi:ferrous iron transport protein A
MRLDQLEENIEVEIVKITCNDELRQRFYSFGIIKGAIIKIAKISLAKNTIEVIVDDTAVGMRIEEAKQIEIKKI